MVRIIETTDGMAVRVEEHNPYHDHRGRFAPKGGGPVTSEVGDTHRMSGMAAASTADIALDALRKGEQPTITPDEVGHFIDVAAKGPGHPDLTELRVEGTLKFGGDGLGIARKDMPQMPEDGGRERFMATLSKEGVPIEHLSVNPQMLHPMQKEISATEASQIAEAMHNGTYRSSNYVTVSKDNYVLDGHHRWGGATLESFRTPGTTLPVERVGLPHDALLTRANEFVKAEGIKSKAMGEAYTRMIDMLGGPDVVRMALEEYNKYHDAHGRFSSGGGAASVDNKTIAGEVGGAGAAPGDGGSVDVKGQHPTTGIMVSYAPRPGMNVVLDANIGPAERKAAITDFVKANRERIKQHPDNHVGIWVDPETGKTHLDVSRRYPKEQRAKAIRAGRSNNQIAVFDLDHGEEIPTGGTGA